MSRLIQLDIIRGAAILGIVLMNVYAFAYPPDYSHSLIWREGSISLTDTVLYNLQTLFITGRFLTLFNLLFGVSLLLVQRKYGQHYLQHRLYWLAFFGLLHGVLLWSGDILLWYALTGLIVVQRGYLQLSSAELWRKAIVFFAIGLIFPLVYLLTHWLTQAGPYLPLDAEHLAAQQQLWTGAYLAQVADNLLYNVDMLLAYALSLFWLSAALMMFGMALYKAEWFTYGYSSTKTWSLFLLGLTISFITVLLDHNTGYGYDLNTALPWQDIVSLLMALAFASALIHWRNCIGLQRWLVPCGRMAFTLYISQTIAMVLLFRVIKPEWFASLERLPLLGIALLLIGLQLLCCRWYLHHFSQGPLEWLWRKLSNRSAGAVFPPG